MAKPIDLILVRHGQSEANVVQGAEKDGELDHPMLDTIYGRHDFAHPLSERGEIEAQIAGKWFRDNGMNPAEFDGRYYSPFFRTRETAALLGGAALWLKEDSIIERDWGLYGAIPLKQRSERFPDTKRRQESSSFYTRYDGGESITDVVRRVRGFMDTLERDMGDKRVIAVTHGELMWTARYVIERLLPEEWEDMDHDKSIRIGNCAIMWYSRQDPHNPEVQSTALSNGWRKMVDPINPGKSPYNGEWVKLPGKRWLSGSELLDTVGIHPTILSDEEIEAAHKKLLPTENQV
jgi:broad specificity phosphatase PhoE